MKLPDPAEFHDGEWDEVLTALSAEAQGQADALAAGEVEGFDRASTATHDRSNRWCEVAALLSAAARLRPNLKP